MNTNNIFKSIRTAALVFIGAGNMLLPNTSDAQLVERPDMTIKGKYNVKMVSGLVLQAAWIKATNPLEIVRPMTDDEMLLSGKDFAINNTVSSLTDYGVQLKSFFYNSYTESVFPANAMGIGMVYADCDDDMSTFQSSAAYLDFDSESGCSTIEAAYLYWEGGDGTTTLTRTYAPYPGLPTMKSNLGTTIGNVTNYSTIKFKSPGDVAYSNVNAERVIATPAVNGRYICFANVTSIVKGKSSGLYWAANIPNNGIKGAGGATGGWTLVIIYKSTYSPNRIIKFWDGSLDLAYMSNSNVKLNFNSGEVPSSINSASFLGIATIDAEDNAGILVSNGLTEAATSLIKFSSYPNGDTISINPFQTEQKPLSVYDRYGVFYPSVKEGLASSLITTWDSKKGTNGNEIIRLPSQRNTLGYGTHHIKLPSNALVPNATSVQMNFPSEQNGSYSVYLAYMAIEAARPVLNFKLRSEGLQKVQPGGEITYVLTAENTGASALPAGAYVLDTLDKSVDFVPGSVQYVNKTEPQTSEISNQGADVNENLKLYLPTLAAGDGVNANDSVVIKFKVKVKDLSRMDIWNLICHRVVRNSAIAYYSNANGDAFTAVTNTPSGCGIPNEYYDVYVDDPAITQQHLITHYINDTIYEQLMAATQAGKAIRMDSLVRTYLADRLVTMGKSASEASLYTLLDENGLQVPTSAAFAFDESNQKFIAELDLSQGCIESFNFEFIIAPAISNLLVQNPHCTGYSDGKVSFTVSRGVPSYNCMLVDSIDGRIIYQAVAPTSQSTAYFEIANLAPGSYKLYVGDQGPLKAEAVVKIVNPKPLSVAISAPDSMCVSYDAMLSAIVSGREASVPLSYVWESSVDSVNWTGMSLTTQSIKTPITEDRYYRVYVCDNFCETYSDVKVVADLTLGCIPVSTDLKQNEEQNTLVYPNPVKTSFTIKTGKSHNDVKVYDMNGAILLQQLASDKATINISNLSKGNYVVDVNNERLIIIKE